MAKTTTDTTNTANTPTDATTTNKKFGALLREIRKDANRNAIETANHLGIAITYLSDVERCTRPPLSADRIRAVAALFAVDPEPLLAAAAAEQGDFRMPAIGLSRKGMNAMAALQRGLPEFDDDFFEALLKLAGERRGGKQDK